MKNLLIIGLASVVISSLVAQTLPPEFEHKRYFENFELRDRFDGVFYKDLEYDINIIKPNVGGDAFHSFEIPEKLMQNKSDQELDRLLYQALMSFSTQKGIEYYSHSREAYRIFIEESYFVRSYKEREKQKDIVYSDNEDLPSEAINYVYQEDSSFGNGVRKLVTKFNAENHEFYVKISNLDKIKYKGFITIADPQEFLLELIIKREGNQIKMYGITAIHTTTFAAIRDRASYSMAYRIYALALWYESASRREFAY